MPLFVEFMNNNVVGCLSPNKFAALKQYFMTMQPQQSTTQNTTPASTGTTLTTGAIVGIAIAGIIVVGSIIFVVIRALCFRAPLQAMDANQKSSTAEMARK